MKAKKLILLMVLGTLLSNVLISQNIPAKSYEGSYLFQGIYPSGMHNKDWFPDDYEVQGVTNDGENWYFTLADQDKTHGIMWRIPKEVNLNGDIIGNPGVVSVHYDNVDELNSQGLWHWGDPDHMEYEGIDYILVPIYGGVQKVVACFRADNLQFRNYAIFESFIGAGWCAVGVDSNLYVSANDANSIIKYDIDWDNLTDENGSQDFLTGIETYPLTKSNGSTLFLTDLQGGEFSSSGEMLYLVSGRCQCAGNGAAWSEKDGIHAIETNTWTQLDQSKKNVEPTNYFSYEYNSGCTWCGFILPPVPVGCHTPEGLTFWDLEDGNAQGVTGSLHVLIDFYTAIEPSLFTNCSEDKLYLYHYSTNVHVDKNSNGGSGLIGIPNNPFLTVSEAVLYYPIWDGSQLIIKSGNYNDQSGEDFPIVIDKRLRINSEGGSAIIGNQ